MRDWLAHRAGATPLAPALHDGLETATYADLDERVEEVAGRLSGLGLGVDDHLAVLCASGPAYVTLVHAAMRVGCVLVPLNTRLTVPELTERLRRADADVLVCDGKTADLAAEAASTAEVPVGRRAGAHEAEAETEAETDGRDGARIRGLSTVSPETFDLPAMAPNDVQLLMFTSGTTGTPKAVALTAVNVAVSAAGSAFRLGLLPDDRWHDPLPMYHMGGLAPVYRSVLYGTSVSVREGGGGFDPAATLAAMHDDRATAVSLVPTMLRGLLDAEAGNPFPESLRFVLLGGAKAPRSLLEECLERDVPVAPTYGMTETASGIATATPREASEAVGCVGHPLVFTDLTLLDEDDVPVGAGEPGEIVVSGPTVAAGYYGDTASTRESFCCHGFRTGDVGYRDEHGRLWVLNRKDDRIVTGGENVDPGEVTAALREHPRVEDAFVAGLPDGEWGERVAALVVGDASADDLDSFLRERLAGFKLPRTVRFVDSLPRTASGTVDRAAAREALHDDS
jgi:O-succinylbenzoic acid--CoA ligase